MCFVDINGRQPRTTANRPQIKQMECTMILSCFGVAENPFSGRWVAFNADTLYRLSEHATESQALAACRRYTDCELRRLVADRATLSKLSRRAI